jgi:hypothetical protein
MSEEIVKLGSCDLSNLRLGKSGRAVKLLLNKDVFKMHTIKMYCPFGVKSVNKDWSNITEYYVDCSLNQSESESAKTYRDELSTLDSKLNELIRENLDMFKVNTSDDLTYSPILRENGNYPKLIRLQLPRDKNGNFTFFAFDENKQKLKITESNISSIFEKRKVFKGIIECQKVWVYNGRIGSIWNLVQLKLSNEVLPERVEQSVIETCIIDD